MATLGEMIFQALGLGPAPRAQPAPMDELARMRVAEADAARRAAMAEAQSRIPFAPEPRTNPAADPATWQTTVTRFNSPEEIASMMPSPDDELMRTRLAEGRMPPPPSREIRPAPLVGQPMPPADPGTEGPLTGGQMQTAAARATPVVTGGPAGTPRPRSGGPDQPGILDFGLAFLSGLSGRGGLNAVRELAERSRSQNTTFDAVLRKTGDEDLARAATVPELARAIIPAVFGPRSSEWQLTEIFAENGQPQKVLWNKNNPTQMIPIGGTKVPTGSEALSPFERGRQTALGKAQGEAEASLPQTLQKAQDALGLIEQIRKHPGFASGTGFSAIIPAIPGSVKQDFISLVDQAKGRAFLEAFESLKGGGQITEVEGRKATEAIARLERTQSEAGFKKALDDLEAIIRRGIENARRRAGQTSSTPSDGGRIRTYNPETGRLE